MVEWYIKLTHKDRKLRKVALEEIWMRREQFGNHVPFPQNEGHRHVTYLPWAADSVTAGAREHD